MVSDVRETVSALLLTCGSAVVSLTGEALLTEVEGAAAVVGEFGVTMEVEDEARGGRVIY